jgi:hypothetical protein
MTLGSRRMRAVVTVHWSSGRWRLSVATILAAVGVVALPSGAGALTFGAKLGHRSANSKSTCAYPPYYPLYSPYGFMNPPWASSCTFFSSASLDQGASEGTIVPLPDPRAHGNQHWVITQVRIKTGNYSQPGRARLTVLAAHRAYNSGEAACCIGAAETATFTLKPNAIVHVRTNLPVESIYKRSTAIYTFDSLALSILDSRTPIPAEFSGDSSGYCSGGFGGSAGYVRTGQERFQGEYGVCGYLVLMQADAKRRGR